MREELAPLAPWALMLGTAIMAAAGWWCQRVRYPAFRVWSEAEFLRRHTGHTFQISLIVIPGMLLQLFGASLMFLDAVPLVLQGANGLCLLGSIGPTFLVSGPIHGRLANGKDDGEIERLIRSNLPRTLFWTAHFGVAAVWLAMQR